MRLGHDEKLHDSACRTALVAQDRGVEVAVADVALAQ